MIRKQVHWLIFLVIIAGVLLALAGFYKGLKSAKQIMDNSQSNLIHSETENPVADIKTNSGLIRVELFEKDAPYTVKNFIKLSESGFYDGTKFHRVIKGFMIQGGDPNSKDDDWSNDGQGGPGYVFKNEDNKYKMVRGVVAMANSGRDTNGSQFFILTAGSAPWLDGDYTIFGKVIDGMDAVDKIENLQVNENDHPLKDATVESVKIIK